MKFKNGRLISHNAVVLGGILLGDTLRLNSYIEQIFEGKSLIAFSSNYNHEVIDLFLKDTDLPIMQNIILPKSEMIQYDWNDFENFLDLFTKSHYVKEFEKVFTPTIEDLHHPLTSFSYNAPNFSIALPDEFIAVQSQTLFDFKNLPEIFKARFPFPVVNLGGSNDKHHIAGSQVENGRSLRETAYIISRAKLMIGVDSCLNQLATQISKPAIKLHWGSWEANHRSIREIGGVDLFKPDVVTIEKTIFQMIYLINQGERDFSSLSQVPEE